MMRKYFKIANNKVSYRFFRRRRFSFSSSSLSLLLDISLFEIGNDDEPPKVTALDGAGGNDAFEVV